MGLSIVQLEAIRDEAFADDISIIDEMKAWTEEEARTFFESGGAEKPTKQAATVPVGSLCGLRPQVVFLFLVLPFYICGCVCVCGGGGVIIRVRR